MKLQRIDAKKQRKRAEEEDAQPRGGSKRTESNATHQLEKVAATRRGAAEAAEKVRFRLNAF